ncbi:MAG: glycosyltransferase [Arhodomonas sp.]|nr:glycosyltransferase [Arhodomonas sp.]
MGELTIFDAASDVAFVGGSPRCPGGQNVLEPAALGIPVLVGPHTFNFGQIVRQLVANGGAREITNHHQLADAVIELLEDPERRAEMGRRAQALIEVNRGATQEVLALVERFLPAR